MSVNQELDQLNGFVSPSALRHDQNQLIKVIGKRMIEARQLCNLTQQEAARRLGYKNSSKLSKIEMASDTNSIPILTLYRASKVYDVSMDFLFGFTDDWERDPTVSQQREIGRWVFEHWERAKIAEVNAIRALYNRQAIIFKSVSGLITRAKENNAYVKKFRENNSKFDDLKGGNRLLYLLASTAEDAMGLSYELQRIRALHDVAKKTQLNLDIFDDVE